MTAVTARPAATPPRPPVAGRRLLARVLRPAVLLPVGLATVVRAATGRVARPGRVAVSGLVGVVAGLIGLVELGLTALGVARGLLYGIVVGGPYADAWGGPSRAGAWAVHAAVRLGVVVVAAGLGLLVGVLHERLTDGVLHGRRVPGRVVAVSAVLTVGVAAFLVAWVRQL